MRKNSRLLIDGSAIQQNIEALRSTLPKGASLIPVIKDDAYGLGLVPVARLLQKQGIGLFAVAHPWEGAALREAGIEADVLVMGSCLREQMPEAIGMGLILTAGRPGIAEELEALAAAKGKTARVHIKLETGLNRDGVKPGEELAALIEALKASPHVHTEGVYTHCRDDFDRESCMQQFALFQKGLQQIEEAGLTPGMRHWLDSAAADRYPELALDAVRIGRGLYMDDPVSPTGTRREAVSWRCSVTDVRTRYAGDTLGYGSGTVLTKETRVAALNVGYGDGLDYHFASQGGEVLLQGRRCRILAVFMDRALVDAGTLDIQIGEEATLFGYDGMGHLLSSQEQAERIGDKEGCGLTAGLSARVERVFVNTAF